MSSYVRRFSFDPGNDVLLNIESINILDLTPPGALKGVGTGTVICVGEFENGPYAFPLEVDSSQDFQRQMGTLGYSYAGVQAMNPSAIARKADGTGLVEYWNGNAFVQLNGKQFSRLILCRANTSVGAVQFTALPYITGLVAALTYSLAPGAVLALDLGAGPVSATFTAAAASVTSTSATYAMAAGDQVTLGYDGAPNFVVTFQAGDTTQGAVIARINAFAGIVFAAAATGEISLTGQQKGTGGSVRVVSASSGGVLTALGLAAGTSLGTGNVGNILSVTQLEAASVVQAAITNTRMEWDSSSRPRISNVAPLTAPYIMVAGATSASVLSAFGLTVGQIDTQFGNALVVSGTVTLTIATSDTVTLGIDGQPNVTTTFNVSDNTVALLVTRINNAFVAAGQLAPAVADGTTHLYLKGQLNSSVGQVRVVSASSGIVLTKLGLAIGTTFGVSPTVGILPAGTVVTNAGAQTALVTTQDVNFTSSGVFIGGTSVAGGGTPASMSGPWSVPVRHALDDGSGLAVGAGLAAFVPQAPDVGSFSCTNLAPISAALTETQVDAAYVAAIAATADVNTVAKQANIIFSARQSNTIRSALRSNAIQASTQGCFGRVACIRPPIGTDKYTALGAAAPGVVATRDERTIYNYIGSNVFVPIIAARGMAGNPANTNYTAFTADGNVNVGSDSACASIMSQLPPEENPGQDTGFTSAINGIETTAAVRGFNIVDYTNFKAAGICALRIDDGIASFQSGVTSVDPGVYPQLTMIARRRMADYIQDSIAQRGKGYSKKLNTFARRKAFAGEVTNFLAGLLSKGNASFQRIAGYTVSVNSNTVDSIGIGIFRLSIMVRTLSSMDSIVLETVIGQTVEVQVTLPQAA